jgi:hypothetical protein
MDIGGVERIRPVEQVGVCCSPGDVVPALGVERAGRVDDDSYEDGTKKQDRGMEEEDPDASARVRDVSLNDGRQVDVFA